MSREALTFLTMKPIKMPGDSHTGENKTFRVLANLANHASPEGIVCVSAKTQSIETGFSERDVNNARSFLIRDGFLVPTGRRAKYNTQYYELRLPGFSFTDSYRVSPQTKDVVHGQVHGLVHGQVHGLVHGQVHGVKQDETVVRVEDQVHNRTELELEQNREQQLQELHEATFTKHRKIKKYRYNKLLSNEWGERYRPYLEEALDRLGYAYARADEVLSWVIAQAFPDDLQVSYTLANLPGEDQPQHATTYKPTREQEHQLANFQNSFGK